MMAVQVVYHDVPAEVARVSAYAWQRGSPPVPLALTIVRDGRQETLTFPVVSEAVVLLHRSDGSYLLDGPFAVRAPAIDRRVDEVWRRSVAGTAPAAGGAMPPIEWLDETGRSGDVWPSCWWRASSWECWGVPRDSSGVVVGSDGRRLLSAVVSTETAGTLRSSAWGRLAIVADRGPGPPPRLRLAAARAARPAQRPRAVRLDTSGLADVLVTGVAPGTTWLTGDSLPPDAWVEIRSARSGPAFLPLPDVADGAPLLPVRVTLDDSRVVSVAVTSPRGAPAAGTLVTTFRLIDASITPPTPGQPPPRRVIVAESIAATDGTVDIDGLGDADYEIVAWHPQFGRGSVPLRRGVGELTIRLQSSGMAQGRVLTGGTPAAGVDVISVPDPSAFASAEDPIDLKGGDARTGADGRFSISLAPGGGGELRVGGSTGPIVRIPLPRAPLPIVDLGDVELGSAIRVSVVLDQDVACDLRAVGPIGRAGLQFVTAARAGPGLFTMTLPEAGSWALGLVCGREERAVAPAVVRVVVRESPQEFHVSVR